MYVIRQKLTNVVDNRDPSEAIAMAEAQIDCLKSQNAQLNRTIGQLKRKIVKLTEPKPKKKRR